MRVLMVAIVGCEAASCIWARRLLVGRAYQHRPHREG